MEYYREQSINDISKLLLSMPPYTSQPNHTQLGAMIRAQRWVTVGQDVSPSRVPLHEEERLLGKITQTPGNLQVTLGHCPHKDGMTQKCKE